MATTSLSIHDEAPDKILQVPDDFGQDQDDTSSTQDLVELDNILEGHEEGEGKDRDEDTEEDEDITKGVPGFRWLKDMEIWARREVATLD